MNSKKLNLTVRSLPVLFINMREPNVVINNKFWLSLKIDAVGYRNESVEVPSMFSTMLRF